jgi:hypothetical protein
VDFLALFGLVGNEGRKRNQLQDTELTRDQATEVDKGAKVAQNQWVTNPTSSTNPTS